MPIAWLQTVSASSHRTTSSDSFEHPTKARRLFSNIGASFVALSILGLAALGILFALPAGVEAEEKYPNRPITFVVPWGLGGGADQLARTTGKLLEPVLGVSLPVINVPGATGQTGLNKLVTSPADGYSLEVLTRDTFALLAATASRFKL